MSRVGECFRCGAVDVVVEDDHPLGTVARRHVYPDFMVTLCLGCHRLRSLVDSRVGVEGSDVVSPWLLVRRLAAFDGLMATAGRPIVCEPDLLEQRAAVEEEIAAMIGRPGEAS